MAKIEGGCSCGKVRYSADAETIFQGVCHCKSCQKANGSSFNAVIAVPTPTLTVTGALTQYDGKGDSGQATHHTFCPTCGSPITGTADVMQGVTMLTVGTLDDPSWVKPAMEIFCDSKMGWVPSIEGAQSFPRMPG